MSERSVNAHFSALLLEALPELRAFALSLTRDGPRADDLVQETILRAWVHADQFETGSNLRAWLFTILRNLFYSEQRRRQHEVDDPEGKRAAGLMICPEQQSHLEFEDFWHALGNLAPLHREALILVGAQGLSYEEAAGVCGVAIGTIKSRVSRARTHLMTLLHVGASHEFGPDDVLKAVISLDQPDPGIE